MLSGKIDGSVEIAGWTCQVLDGELMIYEPGQEGDSEPITFDTATRLLFLLKLVIMNARANRGQ